MTRHEFTMAIDFFLCLFLALTHKDMITFSLRLQFHKLLLVISYSPFAGLAFFGEEHKKWDERLALSWLFMYTGRRERERERERVVVDCNEVMR